MNRIQIVEKIISNRVVAVIRLNKGDDALAIISAISDGGITSIEITMTTPNALKIIEQLNNKFGGKLLVGVGSVLNKHVAQEAINAGAKYVVSPISDPTIIEIAHKNNVPAMPGCFTPTEIFNAYKLGADIIKVFPADINGMAFFKGVLAPMPFLKLMPTGGVSLTNANKWINAGACAVGVGSALASKQEIEQGNYESITKNAIKLVENIKSLES